MASGYEHKSRPPPRTLSGHVARRIQVVWAHRAAFRVRSLSPCTSACSPLRARRVPTSRNGRATSPGRRPCRPTTPVRRPSRARAAARHRRIPRQFEPAPSSGRSSTTASTSRRSTSRSTTPIPTAPRSSCSSPATAPPIPTSGSVRCSSTPADPDSAAASSRSSPSSCLRRGAARPLRHHRVGSSGHRPERAVHRLHRRLRPLLRRARHHARHRAGANSSCRSRRGVRRRLRRPTTPTSSSTSARTTRRVTSTSSAARSVRRRSRSSASATGASSARRGRRCSPTPCGRPCSTVRAIPNADTTESSIQQLQGFETTLATFLAECSADTDCAFHNDGDAEGAFDELMAELDENPIPGTRRSARRQPASRPRAVSSRRCTASCTGRRSRSRSPMPKPATGRACSRSPTATSSVNPTARTATSSRRSRRSTAPTRLSG